MKKERGKSKRLILAAMVGAAVFTVAFGTAASLGGITGGDLGADAAVIASCDSDGVAVSYSTSYSAAGTAGYKVGSVTVSGINNACDGQDISVNLTGAGDASLQEVSSSVPTDAGSTSHTLNFGSSTLAESVTGVHVIIAD
jgi:hypothetical protein